MTTNSTKRNRAKPRTRNNELPRSGKLLLRRIGLQIHKDLFKDRKPVEWLSFKSGVARSSIREIIAGRSNPRILTLEALSTALGYQDVVEFLAAVRSEHKD
jgi:hypothetical protein